MELYTVTKVFGVDAVKTRVFRKKDEALADINDSIRLFLDDPSDVEIVQKENEETYYIVNKSNKPDEYIEFILRRNEVR